MGSGYWFIFILLCVLTLKQGGWKLQNANRFNQPLLQPQKNRLRGSI